MSEGEYKHNYFLNNSTFGQCVKKKLPNEINKMNRKSKKLMDGLACARDLSEID